MLLPQTQIKCNHPPTDILKVDRSRIKSISEQAITIQTRLLRVLQEKEFTPVGGSHSRKADARIIAAADIDLEQKVRTGNFWEDLFYRLRVVTIEIPPLKDRSEDITLPVQNRWDTSTRSLNAILTGCHRKP